MTDWNSLTPVEQTLMRGALKGASARQSEFG
jgi:hypothetical protein